MRGFAFCTLNPFPVALGRGSSPATRSPARYHRAEQIGADGLITAKPVVGKAMPATYSPAFSPVQFPSRADFGGGLVVHRVEDGREKSGRSLDGHTDDDDILESGSGRQVSDRSCFRADECADSGMMVPSRWR